ncbi:hypothetical protein SeMB42_g07666 [Synchytrium endobioticum]|uniref:DNA helicase n=1 Tax=Synchytrium endobioticum TaxID=286115 RepID=A0A507DC85_9FUNG|nr:hypothetical protein SeMB42_g07666 [Synchytrium endobioticum]TPX49204.1 hypothetical protein SeLEV6574_g01591 [Synchytrium endobioticum]
MAEAQVQIKQERAVQPLFLIKKPTRPKKTAPMDRGPDISSQSTEVNKGVTRKRKANVMIRGTVTTGLDDRGDFVQDGASPTTPTDVTIRSTTKPRKSSSQKSSCSLEPLPTDMARHFMHLDALFRAVNTIITFFTIQRGMVCTFDAIKASVESISKGGPFTVEGLSQLKAIAPILFNVFYMQESVPVTPMRPSTPTPHDDKFVLVIEFTDARPPKQTKSKQIVSGKTSKSENNEEQGAVTVDERKLFGTRNLFTQPRIPTSAQPSKQEMVTNLIEKRNATFRSLLVQYHKDAIENNLDPVMTLLEASRTAIHPPPNHKLSLHESIFSSPSRRILPATDRPSSLKDLIEKLKLQVFYRDQIVNGGWKTDEPTSARYDVALDVPFSKELENALKKASGIERLYTHQALAINALTKGDHVIVATPTSSGKSLIYQSPVLNSLFQNSNCRALFIFPTKALAQDQRRAFVNILNHLPSLKECVRAETFDGDTPSLFRKDIRNHVQVIFTNPDMLHVSVLPQHAQWKDFIVNLKFVIVDELHYYTATLGTHCAYVMRRLQRICSHYSNDSVQFISCSATVANPVKHMKTFCGLHQVTLIDQDGAPRGSKHHVLWNPPLTDQLDRRQGRMSTLDEVTRLLVYLMVRGVRTIAFCKARRPAELVLKQAKLILNQMSSELANKVMGYRGGYTPQDRRSIERSLFSGDLLAVVATNALELGIDIGTLDVVLHMGFPYNLASYRQQSGRAGRRKRDSISILIADGDNMLDQYYMNHPEELFGKKSYENVVIDLKNPMILEAHLQCAAAEIPVNLENDFLYLGEKSVVDDICRAHLMFDAKNNFFVANPKYEGYPAGQFPIRCIDESHWRIIDVSTNQEVEDIEADRAYFTLYEGSIFIHQGNSFYVFEVNNEKKYVKVRPTNVDYITTPRAYTDVDPLKIMETSTVPNTNSSVYFGSVRVSTKIFGYFKLNPKNWQILDAVADLENPPFVKDAVGFWLDVPFSTVQYLHATQHDVEFSVHAASHAILSLVPVYVMSTGQTDIRTDCKTADAKRIRPPRLFIYEHNGRSGMASQAFNHVSELLIRSKQTVSACPCNEVDTSGINKGCPGCIQRTTCRHGNSSLDKDGGLIVLRGLLGETS